LAQQQPMAAPCELGFSFRRYPSAFAKSSV
jgi:hypothetical protein